jgi:tetratricopeptide (TPR) repeat protein
MRVNLNRLLVRSLISYLAVSSVGAQADFPADQRGRLDLMERLNTQIKEHPDDYRLYYGRSYLNEQMGNYEAAMADANRAVELNPSQAVGLAHRANIEMRRNDLHSAIIDLSTAIDLDPLRASFYNNRACVYIMNKQFAEARTDLAHALKIDPSLVEAYADMGEVLYKTNDFANAIKFCTAAISRDPSFADPYFYRGSAYFKLGNKAQAQLDLSKAKQLGFRENSFNFRPGKD